jgi:hypothetical protein
MQPLYGERCHGWCSCRFFLRREWKVLVTQKTHAYFFKGFEKQTLWNLEGRRFADFLRKNPIKKNVAFVHECFNFIDRSTYHYYIQLFNQCSY